MKKTIIEFIKFLVLAAILFSPLLLFPEDTRSLTTHQVMYHSYRRPTNIYSGEIHGYVDHVLKTWNAFHDDIDSIAHLKPDDMLTIESKTCNQNNHCGYIVAIKIDGQYVINKHKSKEH